ncbi:methyl-accepting chemotaxis protein [Parahaliea mediterranea]|uniref:HAMP domain-containing protein n=1 Tax=Parahaliea mediterranea TaxID=651086 RepID=A0A939IKY6_9GAMM|nr:methyl-accepting chemotaxis protein [Parahaliea mediterranea]MBN7795915.1 HAMP domain-containing protein [Parahaliea mediterranea]
MKSSADEAINGAAALALNAQRVQILALQERRFEKDVFINIASAEKVSSYFERWQQVGTQLAAELHTGSSLAPDDDLREHYRGAREGLAAYQADFKAVHERIVAGELTTPGAANAAFSEYKANIYRLESHAEEINVRATEHMAGVMPAMNRSYDRAVTGLCAVALLALALAGLLSVVVTRSIVRPLGRAVAAARAISEGDLRHQIAVNGRDEAAQLLAAMRQMSASLSELVAGLRRAGDTVYRGANGVAGGALELSSRTEQQAAALQETAATMEQFSATARRNSQTTQRATDQAQNASERVGGGGEEVRTSVGLIREIATQSTEMNGIIETIDGIAFQTNILALNASVEAARAGEQGRGFAVVAQEVRGLASGATESAGRIRVLLQEIQEKIQHCAVQVENSGDSIDGTVGAINGLASMMGEVLVATNEQINGIDQVTTAVAQIDTVTQQNASLVQESSAAAQSLERQAAELKALVARFRTDEEGAAPAEPDNTRAEPVPDSDAAEAETRAARKRFAA